MKGTVTGGRPLLCGLCFTAAFPSIENNQRSLLPVRAGVGCPISGHELKPAGMELSLWVRSRAEF